MKKFILFSLLFLFVFTISVFCANEIQLYPLASWEKASFNVVDEGGIKYSVLLETKRSKKLESDAVMKFYTDYFKKLGWEQEGPAGGYGNWLIIFKKGDDQCVLNFMSSATDGTDQPNDPTGAKIEFWYK